MNHIQLLEELQAESQKRRSQMRGMIAAWGGIAAGFLVLIGLSWIAKGPPDGATLIIVFSAFASVPTLLTLTSHHKSLLKSAVALSDPKVIPDLLDALDCDAADVKREIRLHLKTLLPQLTTTDASLFDRRHRHLLSGLLRSRDVELIQLTLHALDKVGDQESIGEIRRTPRLFRRPQTKDLAKRVLGDLQFRVAKLEMEQQINAS